MAYKITDECIGCGDCELVCIEGAIMQGEEIYEIDPTICTECVGEFPSPQCAEVCPVDCCIPDPEYKESRQQLMAKWKSQNPDEEYETEPTEPTAPTATAAPSNRVRCPKCGGEAELRACPLCMVRMKGRGASRWCLLCHGTGVIIHCESCSSRKQMEQQAAAKRQMDLEALKRNPFLPYYDKNFRQYR
jgi:hypothetical protein